jgi:hypothetical protein
MATAATTSTALKLSTDKIEKMHVISQGDSGSTVVAQGVDSDKSQTKHVVVHQWTVNGQQVNVMVRVQVNDGVLWIDLVSGSSLSDLSTTYKAMNLNTAVSLGHPSPTADFIDTQASVSAGGT